MAQIKGTDNSSILKIQAFLGLNENPDGDTTLKVGEMAEMRNFRITQDKHLQIRPGSKTILSLADALSSLGQGNVQDGAETRVYGVWRGIAGAYEHILASFGGHIWDIDAKNGTAKDKGSAPMGEVSFFGFGGKVYLLGGGEYKSWDGGTDTAFATVEGYVPLIQTATTPKGEGTLVETVNRLTGKRRVQFSPDGTATVFQLPEKGINEVSSVKSGGEPVTNCTMDLENGTVTFPAVPAAGTNTVEIEYRKGDGARSEVTGMKYSELFNGATDTRVFLYGDGTNRAVYSGVPFATGRASAEYFPDLYELTVGESNTPLTALVRHYSRLMAFKTDSAWAILQGEIGLADGGSAAAFYVQPVNRQFGNEAPGQVRLLENMFTSFVSIGNDKNVGEKIKQAALERRAYVTVMFKSKDGALEKVTLQMFGTQSALEDGTPTYALTGTYVFSGVLPMDIMIGTIIYETNCTVVKRIESAGDKPIYDPVDKPDTTPDGAFLRWSSEQKKWVAETVPAAEGGSF